jgi:hypothetical protein
VWPRARRRVRPCAARRRSCGGLQRGSSSGPSWACTCSMQAARRWRQPASASAGGLHAAFARFQRGSARSCQRAARVGSSSRMRFSSSGFRKTSTSSSRVGGRAARVSSTRPAVARLQRQLAADHLARHLGHQVDHFLAQRRVVVGTQLAQRLHQRVHRRGQRGPAGAGLGPGLVQRLLATLGQPSCSPWPGRRPGPGQAFLVALVQAFLEAWASAARTSPGPGPNRAGPARGPAPAAGSGRGGRA